VTGIIRRRPESQRREGLGEYELEMSQISLLNTVKFTLPFQPSQARSVNSATRSKYRYLDLRNKLNNSYLRLRDDVVFSCRTFLRDEKFMEIETPLLFKSTPEGAREFIVPTRRKGEAYALPQSPQQYKQILMGSGIDRYFQVAKCFRDEDLRADRQPEFTQVYPFLDRKLMKVGFGNGVCGERGRYACY
jgi:aspartyl-tRNA synthetase